MARQKGKRYPSDNYDHRKQVGTTGNVRQDAAAKARLERGGARKRGSHSPRRAPAASAAPAPAAPVPSKDFSAFTRPRASSSAGKPGRAMPSLAELAAEEAPQLAQVSGGTCPGCQRPHSDDDRHCAFCGAPLRHACPKCERPLAPDERYCRECGAAAPAPATRSDPQRITSIDAATRSDPQGITSPPALLAQWEPEDMWWVTAAVDWGLVAMDADLLEEKDRQRIERKAAPVCNKHFHIGGRWKEELELGFAIAAVMFPAAYHHFVIRPDARRRELERREEDVRQAGGIQ
jgi:hypothetical protein